MGMFVLVGEFGRVCYCNIDQNAILEPLGITRAFRIDEDDTETNTKVWTWHKVNHG